MDTLPVDTISTQTPTQAKISGSSPSTSTSTSMGHVYDEPFHRRPVLSLHTHSHMHINTFPTEEFRNDLDKLVHKYSFGMSLNKFKREAAYAWERQFQSPSSHVLNSIKGCMGRVSPIYPISPKLSTCVEKVGTD
jgi:hypothetical protein